MRIGVREVLFFLMLLAVLGASYWFVFRPQNQEIQQARSEIEHKERVLQQLARATSQTSSLAAANEQVRQKIARIEARLPSSKEVDVILEQVADLARSHDLDLHKVKSHKPVAAASYMEQPLEMRMRGDFTSFYAFLLDLERLERITRIPDLQLKRSDKGDGQTEAVFTLSIYFQPDDEEGGAS